MKKQKTAPAESAVQTEKKGTGIQIDKKTVFGITALLLVIMLLAGVLTQVVPRGEYQMDGSGMVINGTYHEFAGDEGKMPWWKIILAPIMVFTSSQITTGIGIVVFIVLIGGTFLILDRSGVLKYIMSSVVRKFEKKKYLLLAVIVFVCMMMSSVVGVLEESLTLVPFAVAISLALGWDSFVGLGISMVSIAFGYTAATFNPFNVGILQTMADLPLFSGLAYRVLFFVCVYASLVLFLIVYAKKIEKNPEKSLCYESDKELRVRFGAEVDDEALNNPRAQKGDKDIRRLRRRRITYSCGVVCAPKGRCDKRLGKRADKQSSARRHGYSLHRRRNLGGIYRGHPRQGTRRRLPRRSQDYSSLPADDLGYPLDNLRPAGGQHNPHDTLSCL